MWWTCNDSFKGERYCPIWLGINHSTNHNCVSFHFFTHSPPNPTPGEKKPHSPGQEREWGPSYSWEYHGHVLMCHAFRFRKTVRFPFSLLLPFAFKRLQYFPSSLTRLGSFFCGFFWRSIFLVWGSGDRLQGHIFRLCKHNTIYVWNEVSWATFFKRESNSVERLSSRLNLAIVHESESAFW